jgi:hypothetical protein
MDACERCGQVTSIVSETTRRVSIGCPRCRRVLTFCDSCWPAVDGQHEPTYCDGCRPASSFRSRVLRSLAARLLLALVIIFLTPLLIIILFPKPDLFGLAVLV